MESLFDISATSTVWLAFMLLAGLALLCLGGSWLTSGSGSFALILKIHPVVVGLTVIAIATSMPEFITALVAVHKGAHGVAIGNIVGSNICNIGLILGVAALILPVRIHVRTLLQETPFLFVMTLLFTGLCIDCGLSRLDGFLLLAAGAGYIAFHVIKSRRETQASKDVAFSEVPDKVESLPLAITLILAGGALLALGADMLVVSATETARRLDVSEELIGVTLVAFGTSVPELAAAIAASLKKQPDLVIGNVIGSNLFNLLVVGGGVAALDPMSVAATMLRFEYPAMILITAVFALFCITQRKLSRMEGGFLLALYFAIILLSYRLQA